MSLKLVWTEQTEYPGIADKPLKYPLSDPPSPGAEEPVINRTGNARHGLDRPEFAHMYK